MNEAPVSKPAGEGAKKEGEPAKNQADKKPAQKRKKGKMIEIPIKELVLFEKKTKNLMSKIK